MRAQRRVIVVGGGLGGLWAALTLAEHGVQVDLFSLFEVKRSHSACAQGGINAVLDSKGEHDSIEQHILDTIKGGAYLANQPPIKSLCEAAPGLIRTFERMGVTFSRTPEGLMDLRLFGGVKKRRTCFAGASTGQQLLYGVDEQVRAQEVAGRIRKHEWWEFLSLVKDPDDNCRGIVAMDLRSLDVVSFRADAVILATGGLGLIYGRSTNSTNSTGAAASRVYQQGAHFANGEFIQFHPTTMLGEDKTRLMSEAARGEGGRIWVPKDLHDKRMPNDIPESARWYFLEEWYPSYGNTVPRDVASRAIWKLVRELGYGIGGEDAVYLDLTHLDPDFIETRLGAILDIYRKFQGVDPVKEPMKIFPGIHYSMGGLWIDFETDATSGGIRWDSPRNHATNIPGLYACGECDYGYHGANRLGANSLLSASYSGQVAGEAVASYLQGIESGCDTVDEAHYSAEQQRQTEINQQLMRANGPENPYALHRELGMIMATHVNVVRDNPGLDQAAEALQKLEARFWKLCLGERSGWANQSLVYARQVHDMIVLGRVITAGARARDESRGSHYKPAFNLEIPQGKFPGDPEFEAYRKAWKENNDNWLKTTIAEHNSAGPRISYEAVDLSIIAPEEPRDYR
ncbi:succinate dehydrogenase (quinone) flavoprotein subunit [Candidatus Endoriftia persephonae]|jgi:succinate dehydrogenase / fumarate reductase flavoprotein subunit|uniref:succinate dehydrogenase n=1 Tax=Candidatus Endoriftia persephonae TaxID=393765 RepID=A0A9J7A1V7_9GAMM|nr:succinate dehydrogenase (quinone) flavoprotein subunit [Candidatus Endoriftia persephone]USF89102.1 succinate dehydrogenase (quinone) flavoprotein subunit [Candidatus Endoriftia persephone]